MLLNPASISVFLPAFNDEATIGKLVSEALVLLKSLTGDYELIVINDGSNDATASVLDELAIALDMKPWELLKGGRAILFTCSSMISARTSLSRR